MHTSNTIFKQFYDDEMGGILVLAAAAMVMVMAFAAFTVDVGYIALTKTQLQIAADAAALAAAMELPAAVGPGATISSQQAVATGRQSAIDVAAANRAGNRDSVYVDGPRDVQFGQVYKDTSTGELIESWGTAPYNAAAVTVRRDQEVVEGVEKGDSVLPLFFAPVIGHQTSALRATAVAAMLPGVGIRIDSGSSATADVLPIALDLPTWEALMNGVGSDNYRYDPATGTVSNGSDGILEVSIYPNGTASLPPGNRGTVDLGSPNNSTADLKRQILYGLNEYDLSFFGGELRTDQGPIILNGDTGISAGIKAQLEAIKGQPRLIPIFTEVSGPGNNAMYTIVKFVGIRIMYVRLTGSASSKTVIVQPAPFTAPYVIRGTGTVTTDSYFSPVSLVR